MLILIFPGMKWAAAPAGETGRPAVFGETAIQSFLPVRLRFDFAQRQAVDLVCASQSRRSGMAHARPRHPPPPSQNPCQPAESVAWQRAL
jgi:hypothetical protein